MQILRKGTINYITTAARRLGLEVVIVVPHGNSAEKNAAMRALGAELVEHGGDFQAALEHARHIAAARGLHAMPSYHRDLVCGIATSALDFLRGAPPLDAVFVPIGMGSGICAMIAARDALGLKTKIVGVAADGAPAIALSFAAKRLLTHPVTTLLADGLACSTPDPEALDVILRHAERIVRVTDEEAGAAIRDCFTATHNIIEGAAAAGLAAVLRERPAFTGRRVGLVLTGGNIDTAVLARVLAAG